MDLVTNHRLSIRGHESGLDACVIKDIGRATVTMDMMATTVEAIIGAVFEDTGANDLAAASTVMKELGFFDELFLR